MHRENTYFQYIINTLNDYITLVIVRSIAYDFFSAQFAYAEYTF